MSHLIINQVRPSRKSPIISAERFPAFGTIFTTKDDLQTGLNSPANI